MPSSLVSWDIRNWIIDEWQAKAISPSCWSFTSTYLSISELQKWHAPRDWSSSLTSKEYNRNLDRSCSDPGLTVELHYFRETRLQDKWDQVVVKQFHDNVSISHIFSFGGGEDWRRDFSRCSPYSVARRLPSILGVPQGRGSLIMLPWNNCLLSSPDVKTVEKY